MNVYRIVEDGAFEHLVTVDERGAAWGADNLPKELLEFLPHGSGEITIQFRGSPHVYAWHSE